MISLNQIICFLFLLILMTRFDRKIVWFALSLNAILSHSYMTSVLESSICFIGLLLLEFTIFQIVVKFCQLFKKPIKAKIKVEFPRIILPEEYLDKYEAKGYKILEQKRGITQYSCVYECLFTERSTNSKQLLAVKVIDLKRYVGIRFGDLKNADLTQICKTLAQNYGCLQWITHKDINSFERIDSIGSNGTVEKLALFSKLANTNLTQHLMASHPEGVDEDCARHWFRQLTDAVLYMQKEWSYADINIKPQNCLLFQRQFNANIIFDLKLSDCGLHIFSTSLGELTANLFYPFPSDSDTSVLKPKQSAEIYAMAAILVLMITGSVDNLEEKPQRSDQTLTGDTGETVDSFNGTIKRRSRGMSDSLIDLISRMLESRIGRRIDIQSIKTHPWLRLI